MPFVAAWALALLALVFGCSVATAADSTAFGVQAGAWMAVSGTVLAIDSRRARLVLRHGPLETAPSGIVTCTFSNGRILGRFHVGDRIDALARTDRHPWLLRDPHLFHRPARLTIGSYPRSPGTRPL